MDGVVERSRSLSNMTDEMTPRSEAEGRSLDRVQRVLVSALIIVVVGMISAVLALYLVLGGMDVIRHSDVVGLWVMVGVIGLISAGLVLLINRRRPYHPLVVLGLIPMAASWYWIFH
jgi:CHASE2 domain-containing sensor protein